MGLEIDKKKFKEARIAKRLAQIDVAERSGLHAATINRMELGKGGFGIRAIRAVEKVLGVDIVKTNSRRSA